MIAERHPEAVEICQRPGDPLPDGSIATPYLDFANRLARERVVPRHPFDTEAGIERVSALLADRDSGDSGPAISAAASIPFLAAGAREPLLDSANAHPDALVRLEAAWAMAKLDFLSGHRRLIEFCADPRFSTRKTIYLEELGLTKLLPIETQEPDFRAMADLCDWLAHPMEYGCPPDEITLYDTRELYWPPTERRERLWLFKDGYGPRGEGELCDGIGLVGTVTFALSITTPDLSLEDVYGLHCSWELQQKGDPRAPDKPSAAAGRNLMADVNPGFPRA